MKGRFNMPRILDRLRPSVRLTSTQLLSQCAATCMCGSTVHAINFPSPDGRDIVVKEMITLNTAIDAFALAIEK